MTAALVAGILADGWLEPNRLTIAMLVISSIVVSILFVLTRKDLAATVAIIISTASAGALLSFGERQQLADSRLKRLFDTGKITPNDAVELTGTLAHPPEPAPDAHFLDLDAESLRVRAEVIAATGCARLMLPITDEEAANEFKRLGLDYGSRVRLMIRLERALSYGNPGSPDFNDFLELSGYDLKGTIKSPLLIEHIGAVPANRLLAALYRFRLRALSAIDAHFDPRVAGTLKAMLLGNRYFLDPEAIEQLRESSTFHVLSISGMHVGIIAWVLVGGWSPNKRRRAGRVCVALLALWAYAVMVGLQPPVARATVMISVGLIGPLMFRRAASINTVSLAAFIMLALKPALVADPGFQLSFIAVAGIVAIALPIADTLRSVGEWRPAARTPHPPACPRAVRVLAESLFWNERRFNEEMRRAPVQYRMDKSLLARRLNRLRAQAAVRAVVLLIVTSLAIQLSTLPLVVFYFNRVSPIGILLNVAAGLFTAVVMLAAIAAIVLSAVSLWLAAKLELLVVAAHYLLVNSITPFADIPGSTFRVAHYEGWQAIIYAIYFAPLLLMVALIDRWRPVAEMGVGGQRPGASEPGVDRREVAGAIHPGPRPLTPRGAPAHPHGPNGHPVPFAPIGPWPLTSGPLLCVTVLFVAIAAVVHPIAGSPDGKLTIHFLDVGQGDSALVVFPGGATMLIDGGGELRFGYKEQHDGLSQGDQQEIEETEAEYRESTFSVGEAVVSRFLWSLGLTRIDYMLVTHSHADHIGGLSDVAQNFPVGQAIIGRVPAVDYEYGRFAEIVLRRRIPVAAVSAGQRFEVQGVTVEVLWPPRVSQAAATSGNNDSVVLRLVYGSISILLAGDIEQVVEDALVQSGISLHAQVLKVPDHGSKTSSSNKFIDRVQPECAVISVGERSRYSHPQAEVVDRYLTRGVKLFETGRHGTVTVATDGSTLNVRTYKN